MLVMYATYGDMITHAYYNVYTAYNIIMAI